MTNRENESRLRASTACIECKTRRCKCVMLEGKDVCERCERFGVACIAREADRRKQPSSKAYVSLLYERIELLEDMLRESGQSAPPMDQLQDRARRQMERSDLNPAAKKPKLDTQHSTSKASSSADPLIEIEPTMEREASHPCPISQKATKDASQQPHFTEAAPSMPNSLQTLTTQENSEGNITAQTSLGTFSRTYSPDHAAKKLVIDLPVEERDFLVHLYFSCFNCTIPIVCESAFRNVQDDAERPVSSSFLYLCILAMGLRFSGDRPPQSQKQNENTRENFLHMKAKRLVDNSPATISLLGHCQGLIILADLELGVGRTQLASRYLKMASGLAVEYIKTFLHNSHTQASMLEPETLSVVHSACQIYSIYCFNFDTEALVGGSRLSSSDCSKFASKLHILRQTLSKNFESDSTQSNDAWHFLATKSWNIGERVRASAQLSPQRYYLALASIDSEMCEWYASLPGGLRWLPENILSPPLRFLLLHQTYHFAMMMLHKDFVDKARQWRHERMDVFDIEQACKLSNTICHRNALRIAEISQYRIQTVRETEAASIIEMQHFGNAVAILASSLTSTSNTKDRTDVVQHLKHLLLAISRLSKYYDAAGRMASLLAQALNRSHFHTLQAELNSICCSLPNIPSSTMPWDSADDAVQVTNLDAFVWDHPTISPQGRRGTKDDPMVGSISQTHPSAVGKENRLTKKSPTPQTELQRGDVVAEVVNSFDISVTNDNFEFIDLFESAYVADDPNLEREDKLYDFRST